MKMNVIRGSALRSAFHFLLWREAVVRCEPELSFYRVGEPRVEKV